MYLFLVIFLFRLLFCCRIAERNDTYITFNDIAFQLAGAPWVIKSYTKNHITLIQNEASPDKDKIATIELDRVD